jgi:NitT/TauT family transport system substrate-binding protein
MPTTQTRREFLTALSLAGAAGILSPRGIRAAERPLETTSIRIGKLGAICLAPQYVSEDLLRAEGFTDIRYVEVPPPAVGQAIGRSEADFSTAFAVDPIQAIDAGSPIVVLAGVHIGCYELFAKPDIRRITELKGKSVAADSP